MACIIGEFYPLQFFSVPQKKDFPKVFQWMNTTPQQARFIFMPIYNWDMQPYVQQELFREYYSTVEFRKMVNGYSGFSPPPWQEFIYSMNKTFPNNKSIQMLRKIGINYIIVDKSSYDTDHKNHIEKYDGTKIITALKSNPTITLIKTLNNFTVFSLDVKR